MSVDLVSADLTEISDSDALACDRRHLDCISQGKLMIDRRLLVVACLVVNDTQVDVGEELACYVSHFFVARVVVNSIAIVLCFGLA